jgi:hypothetical protein
MVSLTCDTGVYLLQYGHSWLAISHTYGGLTLHLTVSAVVGVTQCCQGTEIFGRKTNKRGRKKIVWGRKKWSGAELSADLSKRGRKGAEFFVVLFCIKTVIFSIELPIDTLNFYLLVCSVNLWRRKKTIILASMNIFYGGPNFLVHLVEKFCQELATLFLKGQCHEIFDPRFFSSIDHP